MTMSFPKERTAIFWCSLFATIGYGVSFPFLAISLEALGASPLLIGINAAMPPLAWLLATPYLPRIVTLVPSRLILAGLLALVGLSLLLMVAFPNVFVWTPLRFVFGGAIGFMFRYFEYRLTLICDPEARGRQIGIYSALFLGGIVIGSLLQPALGQSLIGTPIIIFGTILIGLVPLFTKDAAHFGTKSLQRPSLASLLGGLPLVIIISIVIYGLVEDLMAYLMSVVALHSGHSEEIAAYTLTAFALGALIGAVPVGYLGDRFGRPLVLRVLFVLAVVASWVLTLTLTSPLLLLGSLFAFGLLIPGIYNTSLAQLADDKSPEELAAANAVFGTLYAGASIIGPLLFGTAMSVSGPMGAPALLSLILSLAMIVAIVRKST